MNIKELDIKDLKPYENNPRKNDEAVEYVANSIKEFGFKVPIVIDKNNVIVAGHTRYMACKKLGIDKVPCIIADDLTDEQIKAYRIADNKTSDFSFWDNKLLLEELSAIPDDLFTGFNLGEEFNNILDEKELLETSEEEFGMIYEVTFKSENKEKIETIKEYWDNLE